MPSLVEICVVVQLLLLAVTVACRSLMLSQSFILEHNARMSALLLEFVELEDEDCEPEPKRPTSWMRCRSSVWYEEVLLPGADCLWIEHLRLPRSEVERIAAILTDELSPNSCVRDAVPLLKRVCIALFKLASCSEYRVVGDLFGVSPTTVHRCLVTFCFAMTKVNHLFIKFPSLNEAIEISERIERQHGYIQGFGAIDGSHVAISPPSSGLADYLNRKMYASIVLQGLVDDRYQFRDLSCKCPGSMHDAAVFMNSTLFDRLERSMLVRDRDINGVQVPLHILGDPAYPLSTKIIKGYVGRNLSCEQESFNVYHSAARMMVENAFGRLWLDFGFGYLLARWRMISKKLDCRVELAPYVIMTCCCLHNICESLKTPMNLTSEDMRRHTQEQPPTEIDQRTNSEALLIRDTLTDYLAQTLPLRRSARQ